MNFENSNHKNIKNHLPHTAISFALEIDDFIAKSIYRVVNCYNIILISVLSKDEITIVPYFAYPYNVFTGNHKSMLLFSVLINLKVYPYIFFSLF